MQRDDSDADWEHLAANDPYWAVITQDRFRKTALTEDARVEFFASGERFVEWALTLVNSRIATDFAPRRALDFGCGVGRLLLPLSKRCDQVVGVDVSQSMLDEAARQLEASRRTNVELVVGDDDLSGVSGPFDLITSYIVLQHIQPARGQKIVGRLVDLLGDRGVGVIHVLYSKTGYLPNLPNVWTAGPVTGSREVGYFARVLLRVFKEWWRGDPYAGQRVMRMHAYTLNPLFHALQMSGVRRFHTEFTDHGGEMGMLLFFQKNASDPYLA